MSSRLPPIPGTSSPHPFYKHVYHNLGPDPNKTDVCGICQRRVAEDDIVTRHACGSYAHVHCAEHWLEYEQVRFPYAHCPGCNGELTMINGDGNEVSQTGASLEAALQDITRTIEASLGIIFAGRVLIIRKEIDLQGRYLLPFPTGSPYRSRREKNIQRAVIEVIQAHFASTNQRLSATLTAAAFPGWNETSVKPDVNIDHDDQKVVVIYTIKRVG